MQNILTRTLSSLWRSPAIWLRWSAARHKFEYEPILRSDLFNAQQMADHGIVLARQHVLGRLSRKDALLGRLTVPQNIAFAASPLLRRPRHLRIASGHVAGAARHVEDGLARTGVQLGGRRVLP